MSLFASLIDKLLSPVFAFADECWGRDATSPIASPSLLGFDDAEAALPGGETRDNSLSNRTYGDWPFVPADLKISRFHGRREYPHA